MSKADEAVLDAPKKKKKAKAVDLGDGVRIKVKVKDKSKKKKAGKKAEPAKESAFDQLAKLADHPLVADLIAVGATAAVAALAQRGLKGKESKGEGGSAKLAGKAAAAAIGKRLMSEINDAKNAAVDAAKKD